MTRCLVVMCVLLAGCGVQLEVPAAPSPQDEVALADASPPVDPTPTPETAPPSPPSTPTPAPQEVTPIPDPEPSAGPTVPPTPTAEPPQVLIARLIVDPPGNDQDNLNGEIVAIVNLGSQTVDMSGWAVVDASDRRYDFPTGYGLLAGASVDLHSGCGEDSIADLYWCTEPSVWNNDGDVARLLDPTGTAVSVVEHVGGDNP